MGPQAPPAPSASLRVKGAPLRGRVPPMDYLDNPRRGAARQPSVDSTAENYGFWPAFTLAARLCAEPDRAVLVSVQEVRDLQRVLSNLRRFQDGRPMCQAQGAGQRRRASQTSNIAAADVAVKSENALRYPIIAAWRLISRASRARPGVVSTVHDPIDHGMASTEL